MKDYEPYIDIIEFNTPDLKVEALLFDIYKNRGQWDGAVGTIISDLFYQGVNRLLPDNFGKYRTNCQQKCMRTGNCHWCYNNLDLA